MHAILGLDQSGTPHSWLNIEDAALHYAKNQIAWEAGSTFQTLRGGINSSTDTQSLLQINSIIAVKGKSYNAKNYDKAPAISRAMLFKRDRNCCAYCGDKLPNSQLELEHVIPSSKGGKTSWMNLVSACRYCNGKKNDRTPEQAGMKLLYVPYVPNRHEAFILSSRNILADQMAFLVQGLPAHSRLLA